MCSGAVLLAVVSGLVGSKFASPNQQVADAKAPPLTPITAPVKFSVLQATIAVRAQVVDSRETTFGIPDDIGSDLPVVTQLNAQQGSEVHDGSWIAAIAGRPIIAMVGSIPAFRDMSLGDTGVDVQELQTNLHQLGYLTGSDAWGTFGKGTQAAVRRLYENLGFSPALEGQSASADLDGDVYVPRGEVVFFPTLPEQVVALSAKLGETLTSDASVGRLGSGSIAINSQAELGTQSIIRPGQSAYVYSDVSDETFSAIVTSVASQPTTNSSGVATYAVTLRPRSTSQARMLVGQNVQVTIKTASSGTKTWIVPVAAITTTADGKSFITVMRKLGHEAILSVTPGLVAGGEESINPKGAKLRVGDLVVVGVKN